MQVGREDWRNRLPLLLECDILIVGGGPAGSAAGIAAARLGARTVIVERNGFLGGNITAGGIDTAYGVYSVGKQPVKTVGGIPDEIFDWLQALDASYERRNTYGAGTGITFSIEHMKLVLEQMAREAGVQLVYHAQAPDVFFEHGRPAGVIVPTKQGLKRIAGRFLVDTTGDADIIAFAGGAYERPGAHAPVQSCTTVFFMAHVDVEAAQAFGKQALWAAMEAATTGGKYDLPRVEGSFHATPYPGLIEANMTRIPNVDVTDVLEVSAAEVEGRRQVQEYVRFLVDNVPGFGRAYLVKTGPQMGTREGRRAIGDYVLTRDDVIEGRRFADVIVRCGQPIEDHLPGRGTRWVYVKDYGDYDIPYRCLVPLGLDNVLTAGRCLSATHDAHASARSSATAMGMGQAAGVAAALAVRGGQGSRDIDIAALQQQLRAWGAPL
jgi:ribulose 1,5-bisphosphate synthetase/thiazole synthase